MPGSETIFSVRYGSPLCALGSFQASGNGLSYRNDTEIGYGNKEYFPSYPLTTPDNIVYKTKCPHLDFVTAGCFRGISTVTCSNSLGSLPTSPYIINDTEDEPYQFEKFYPRWEAETAYDWNNDPITPYYGVPNQWPSSSCFFSFPSGLTDLTFRSTNLSYDTLSVPNSPEGGGSSHYIYITNFSINTNIFDLDCFNDGAEITINVVIKKSTLTLTPVEGSVGLHTFTYGEEQDHMTITRTITLNQTGENRVESFQIPTEEGCITWVNDYYISSVVAP